MALAFHILAHKDPAQVERLGRAVLGPEHTLVLHFDRRASRELQAPRRRLASTYGNGIVQRLRTLLWAGDRIAQTQAEAITLALATGRPWTLFINVSGQCLPPKTVEFINAFLTAGAETSSLMRFDSLTDGLRPNARGQVRFTYYRWSWVHRVTTQPGVGRRQKGVPGAPFRHHPKRTLATGFQRYEDSNSVMLPKPACDHPICQSDCQRLLNGCHHAGISNELFFATALRGSRWGGPCDNRSFRDQDFPSGTISQRNFTRSDPPMLRASAAFFARKFAPRVDAAVLDELEELQTCPTT